MNVYQSIEWVREERGNFSINRKQPDTSDLGRWIKILVTMAKNLVNSQWLPLGSKSINLSIYANKKVTDIGQAPFFPCQCWHHLPKLLIFRILPPIAFPDTDYKPELLWYGLQLF